MAGKFWGDMTEEERAAWLEENKELVEELEIPYFEFDTPEGGDSARDSGAAEGGGSW